MNPIVVIVDKLDSEICGWPRDETPALTYALTDNGIQLAGLYVFSRSLRSNICEIEVAAIGHVFTRDDCRHKGCATDLLTGVHLDIADKGYLVAILISRPRNLYERCGYVMVGGFECEVKNGQFLYVRSLVKELSIFPGEEWHLRGELF